jgi:hypothetical protein
MRALRQGRVAELRRVRQRKQYWREINSIGTVDGVEFPKRSLDALEAAHYLDPGERQSKQAIARAISRMLADL